MKTTTATLFDEFATAYRGGEAPDVLGYLERAGDDADSLAQLIDRFLQAVPARAASEEEIVLMQARLEHEPPLLVLRQRRRLTRDAVVSALVGALGLDTAKSAKVKGYFSDLEVGVLDPKPVNQRVWDALVGILDANVRVLAGLRPPPPSPTVRFQRRAGYMELHERVVASSDLLVSIEDVTPAVDDRDEVDRLFTGSG